MRLVAYLVYHRPSMVIVLHSVSRTYFLLIPHLHWHCYGLVLATQKCLCSEPWISCRALNGFSVLQFVQPVPELLAEIKIKKNYLHCVLPSCHSPIRAFTQCHLKWRLLWHIYYFSNIKKKQIDRSEVIGVAKEGEHGALSPSNLNATNDKEDDNKVYCLFHFSFFYHFCVQQ